MNRPKNSMLFKPKYSRRWTDEETRRFINARIKYDTFFHDRLYSTQELWEQVGFEAKLPESWRRLKKKWSNLIYKYRKTFFDLNQIAEAPFSSPWPFFDLIHSYESVRKGQNLIHSYESVRKGQNVNQPTSKNNESHEDNSMEDYPFMHTDHYTIVEAQPHKIRTYKRVPVKLVKVTKSVEAKQPLLRIDQTIFKKEPLDINTDPNVIKIESDSEIEEYEVIPSPKQDYPSDPVEYDTFDELQAADLSKPSSPQPDATQEKHHKSNQTDLADHEKLPPQNESKKRKKSTPDEDKTYDEKKLRREFMKCTNVFLKFMKLKFNIDPDSFSSESDSE